MHPNLTVKSTLQHLFHHLGRDLTTVKMIPYNHFQCREMQVAVEPPMDHIKFHVNRLPIDFLIILMVYHLMLVLAVWECLPNFPEVISLLWLRHRPFLLDR